MIPEPSDLHGVEKLDAVHPQLAEATLKILAAMATLGFPCIVTAGLRTVAEQQALYAKGRSVKGRIVTNLNGVKKRSNHQAREDGFGHAVDIVFFVEGGPSWAESNPWGLLGAMGKALGLRWGGDWKGLRDRPHFELG